jgi:hypothetical protein
MKMKFPGLLAVGLLAASMSANALPISATADNTYIFNFDFVVSAATPSPIYSDVHFHTGLDASTVDAGDSGTWVFFGDPGAGGAEIFSIVLNFSNITLSFPSLTDGIFSARLSMTSGSVIVDPRAIGESFTALLTGVTNPISVQIIQPTPVPEPGTLALLSIGLGLLASLGLTRRKGA